MTKQSLCEDMKKVQVMQENTQVMNFLVVLPREKIGTQLVHSLLVGNEEWKY